MTLRGTAHAGESRGRAMRTYVAVALAGVSGWFHRLCASDTASGLRAATLQTSSLPLLPPSSLVAPSVSGRQVTPMRRPSRAPRVAPNRTTLTAVRDLLGRAQDARILVGKERSEQICVRRRVRLGPIERDRVVQIPVVSAQLLSPGDDSLLSALHSAAPSSTLSNDSPTHIARRKDLPSRVCPWVQNTDGGFWSAPLKPSHERRALQD